MTGAVLGAGPRLGFGQCLALAERHRAGRVLIGVSSLVSRRTSRIVDTADTPGHPDTNPRGLLDTTVYRNVFLNVCSP